MNLQSSHLLNTNSLYKITTVSSTSAPVKTTKDPSKNTTAPSVPPKTSSQTSSQTTSQTSSPVTSTDVALDPNASTYSISLGGQTYSLTFSENEKNAIM